MYYRYDGIRVTRDFLFVNGRRFSLFRVENLRTVRSRIVTPGLARGFLWSNLAVFAAGWPMFRWWTLVLTALVAASFTVILLRRRSDQPRELWAEYGGRETRLLVVRNSQRYGQICRAVLRARESAVRPALPPRRSAPPGQG